MVTVFDNEAREREARAFFVFLVFQGKKAIGAICAGADRSLSTLGPTPTVIPSKKDKQTEISARVHFIEGEAILILIVK